MHADQKEQSYYKKSASLEKYFRAKLLLFLPNHPAIFLALPVTSHQHEIVPKMSKGLVFRLQHFNSTLFVWTALRDLSAYVSRLEHGQI